MILILPILLLCVGVECRDDERERLVDMNYRCVRDQATIMESVLIMQNKMERQERDNEYIKADIKIQSNLMKQTELMETIWMMQNKMERQERDMEEIKAKIEQILGNQQNNGWTVIQRRVDGDVSFDRTWREFKYGFGDIDGSFWIGLEKLYELTKAEHFVLHVDINHFNGSSFYADYNNFRVGSELDGYRLLVSGYHGNVDDGLVNHNGMMFSTKDMDNDIGGGRHCADQYKSGWWFYGCIVSNLNGIYWEDPSQTSNTWNGTMWPINKKYSSLKFAQMKIQPFKANHV